MNLAIDLVWKVFLEYEAPDYTEEGIQEFRKAIYDTAWIEARDFYGAYDENRQHCRKQIPYSLMFVSVHAITLLYTPIDQS